MPDFIDREALIESAGLFEAQACARGCGKSILHLAKVWLLNEVNKAPAADVAPVVHGRWMKTCLPDIYHCTNCKIATKMDELCDSEILRAYCPNCGAKMDGTPTP